MNRLHLAAAIAAAAFASPALAKHGHGNAHPAAGPPGHGVGGCPPGLAKKNSQCMPPGRYKKLFDVGGRVPAGYPGVIGYNQVPHELRDRYSSVIDPGSRYIYDRQYLYRIDPTTMVVTQVLNTLLRP